MAACHCQALSPSGTSFLELHWLRGLFLVIPGQCLRRRHSCKALPTSVGFVVPKGLCPFSAHMTDGYLDTRARDGEIARDPVFPGSGKSKETCLGSVCMETNEHWCLGCVCGVRPRVLGAQANANSVCPAPSNTSQSRFTFLQKQRTPGPGVMIRSISIPNRNRETQGH